MIAKLEFNLDEPEDRRQFDIASNAENMVLAWVELHAWLRQKIKYEENKSEEVYATYREVQRSMCALEDDFGLNVE